MTPPDEEGDKRETELERDREVGRAWGSRPCQQPPLNHTPPPSFAPRAGKPGKVNHVSCGMRHDRAKLGREGREGLWVEALEGDLGDLCCVCGVCGVKGLGGDSSEGDLRSQGPRPTAVPQLDSRVPSQWHFP